MAGMFDFLGGQQYTGGGIRMNPNQYYADGLGFRPPMQGMAQGEGMTMASMPQDFGQVGGGAMAGRMPMMMASSMLAAGQPKQAPMVQNNIPMGRNLTYQDIMKMYGIQGLMG